VIFWGGKLTVGLMAGIKIDLRTLNSFEFGQTGPLLILSQAVYDDQSNAPGIYFLGGKLNVGLMAGTQIDFKAKNSTELICIRPNGTPCNSVSGCSFSRISLMPQSDIFFG
jgi:hypothetical protein